MTRFDPFKAPFPRPARTSLTEGELDHWCARLVEVPDLRFAKVMRVRRAIATHAYDEAHILDRILGTLEDDVGILCRRNALPNF